MQFNDDSYSKLKGIISNKLQLVEMPFQSKISYINVIYDNIGILGLGLHTYKKNDSGQNEKN